jgi:phosphatidylglycerol:prolipoprotein diacylglycerol transferase
MTRKPVFPDSLHVGPLPIHLFGIFMALGFLAAGAVVGREFERKGYERELASSLVVWTAVGGVVGARLWLILDAWDEFLRAPVEFLFTGGGFVWYGGLVGGALAATLFFRRHGIPWLRGATMAAPGLAIGQAIGRIGCQVSGDGDWGRVTTLPWGMAYPHAVVGWPYPPGVRVHPTPVYECLAYLAVFAFLWRHRREPAPDGSLFAWYLVLAGTARFLVEFVRVNPPVVAGLTEAQLTSLVLVCLGAWRLVASRTWRPAAA